MKMGGGLIIKKNVDVVFKKTELKTFT